MGMNGDKMTKRIYATESMHHMQRLVIAQLATHRIDAATYVLAMDEIKRLERKRAK